MRRLLLVLAGLLLLAGCGQAAIPAGGSGGIGDTLHFDTMEGASVDVTVLDTKRLPAAGDYRPELYGVKLRLEAVGEGVYRDAIGNCCVLLFGTDQQLEAEIAVLADDGFSMLGGQFGLVNIMAGDAREGWVYFALDEGIPAKALQFTADSGWGEDSGKWSLE